MSFGVTFVNNSDVVTLDSEFSRLVVLFSARYSGGAFFPSAITSQEPPLVFVRPDTAATFQWVRILGGPGNWTGWSNTSPVNVPGTYFVAAYESRPTATYGVRLWDSNSKLLFDSGTPCAQFTRVAANWTFLGQTNTSPGRWYQQWATSGNLVDGDYMMINNIAMDLPGNDSWSKLSCSWDYPNNRIVVTLSNIGDFRADGLFLPIFFAKPIV